MITPTLTRLFVIKIVASKSLGFSSNCKMVFDDFESSVFNALDSFGPREKKAASEADIIIENNNKISITRRYTNWSSPKFKLLVFKKIRAENKVKIGI